MRKFKFDDKFFRALENESEARETKEKFGKYLDRNLKRRLEEIVEQSVVIFSGANVTRKEKLSAFLDDALSHGQHIVFCQKLCRHSEFEAIKKEIPPNSFTAALLFL